MSANDLKPSTEAPLVRCKLLEAEIAKKNPETILESLEELLKLKLLIYGVTHKEVIEKLVKRI